MADNVVDMESCYTAWHGEDDSRDNRRLAGQQGQASRARSVGRALLYTAMPTEVCSRRVTSGTALLVRAAVTLAWLAVTASSDTRRSSHFARCPRAGTFQGQILRNVSSQMLRCFTLCSADDDCKSLNVCPSTGHVVSCQLLSEYSPWFCQSLNPDLHKNCFHAEKTTKCQNGGRLRPNNTCRCDFGFMGPLCSSHTRDCKEATELINKMDVTYPTLKDELERYIKPRDAPSPFLVQCWVNGETLILVRVQAPDGWSQVKWDQLQWHDYEYSIGSFATYNYFIGLRNMHFLLQQATYRLNLRNFYHDTPVPIFQPSYGHVKLADSAHDYALSYNIHTTKNDSQVIDKNTGVENFKGPNTFHHFCTNKKGNCNCTPSLYPGWYSTNCTEFSPFADVAKWPYPGRVPITLKETQYFLERDQNFY